ncbi:MAG: hypothetical protein AAFY60_01540, partial [Myxococcota bacterium]
DVRLEVDVLNEENTAIATGRIEGSSALEYVRGAVDGFVNSEEPRIVLFRGAPPVVQQATQAMNAQRLEALRALGYIQ